MQKYVCVRARVHKHLYTLLFAVPSFQILFSSRFDCMLHLKLKSKYCAHINELPAMDTRQWIRNWTGKKTTTTTENEQDEAIPPTTQNWRDLADSSKFKASHITLCLIVVIKCERPSFGLHVQMQWALCVRARFLARSLAYYVLNVHESEKRKNDSRTLITIHKKLINLLNETKRRRFNWLGKCPGIIASFFVFFGTVQYNLRHTFFFFCEFL